MVNSVSSSSSATTAAAASSSSYTELSDSTKSRLEALGIDTSSITSEAEGQSLLIAASLESQQQQQGQGGEGQECPWADTMEELGISPTGSQDGDIAAINAALESMDYSEAMTYATSLQSMGLSVDTPQDPNMSNAVGQTFLANYNKYLLEQ